jgi:SAM-dependent methyltransferase
MISPIFRRAAAAICRHVGYDLVPVRPRGPWPEETSRFEYQKQFRTFDIPAGAIVLDVGSGAYPFPLATILADRYLETTRHRAESIQLDGRPFLLVDISRLPFAAKSIDFIYCSHVLEHVDDPIAACAELVRVARQGFVETPTLAKDMLFAWAEDMHKWHVVAIANRLLFFEYSKRQTQGIRSPVWREAILGANHHPMQEAYYANPDLFNVMFSWQGGFDCSVYYLSGNVAHVSLR